jgi:hypothetical protein
MDKNHKTVTSDADYDVTFHPAFASACIVKPKDGQARELYRQPKDEVVNCKDEGHPKRHVVKLKGKGNRRDITITIDDPEHSIHALTLELYEEGRSPKETAKWEAGDTFTVLNDAKTCPPHCDPT